MKIPIKHALQIVSDISEIVNQNINIMDNNGVIIASTDENRIGQFHFIAKKIIDEKLDEFFVSPEMETKFMKKGLNLSIYNNDTIIGVVGITGDYAQVSNYGQIVRRMTEILVLESDNKIKKEFEKKLRIRYLDELLRGKENLENLNFIEKGHDVGIDISIFRRVVAISIESENIYENERKLQEKLESANSLIEKTIKKYANSHIFVTTNKTFCLIAAKTNNKLDEFIQDIKLILGGLLINFKIGVDSLSKKDLDIRARYRYALKAWSACSVEDNIKFYDDINMELFLSDIKFETKEEYIHKIFKDSTKKEIKDWIALIELYFKHDGAITKMSQDMYIHKNTLQYKLKKLAEQTGYDVRILSQSAVLYMATCFYRDIEKYFN